MYRSWGYILMFMATLAGVVALLWPTPPVRTIEEITMPVRQAPARPEPPPKKQASRPSPPKPPPKAAPPAVIERMPPQNTTTRRGAAVPQNGMQPGIFGQPAGTGVLDRGAAPSPAAPAVPPRPVASRPITPPPPEPPARQDAAQ